MTTWLLERSMAIKPGVYELTPNYEIGSDDVLYVLDSSEAAIVGPFEPKILPSSVDTTGADGQGPVALEAASDELVRVTKPHIVEMADGPELNASVVTALDTARDLGTDTVSPEAFFGAEGSDDEDLNDEESGPTLQEVFNSQSGLENADFSEQVVTGAKELADTSLRGSDLSDARLEEVTFRNVNLRDVDFRGAELQEATFTGRKTRLAGANFTAARLDGATFEVNVADSTFSDAQMRDVDLRKATLEGADFSHARLKRANLNQSEPERATFREAVLQDVKTTGAHFEKVSFEGADLSNTTFVDATFEDVDFDDADLRDTTFEGCTLDDAGFVGAKMRGVDLRDHDTHNLNFERADLGGATLSRSNFDSARFTGARLSNTDLTDCDLSGVSLSDVRANGATFDGANLEFATLSGADLTDASFEDTRLYTCQLVSARLGSNTDFDGIYDYLAAGHQEFEGQSTEHPGRRAASVYRTLEAVYRNNSLTSKSLRYLRKRKDAMLTVNRDEGRWLPVFVDGFLGATTAHGTRVSPLLKSSAGFVLLTAGLHYTLGSVAHETLGRLSVWDSGTGLLGGFLQALVFSLLSFTGLGYGRFSPATTVGEALAVVQSGAGVVVFGLLVFVLSTRASR